MSDTSNSTALADELQRIEESATYSAQNQFAEAKFWRGVNLVLGAPAAVLAAISGATGLADADNHQAAAVLALIAAGLGAVLTTVNASDRGGRAHASANGYLAVQTEARQARLVDLPHLPAEEARARLSDLTGRLAELNATADIPSWLAAWRARRNIRKGRQQYEIDP